MDYLFLFHPLGNVMVKQVFFATHLTGERIRLTGESGKQAEGGREVLPAGRSALAYGSEGEMDRRK